MAAGSVFCTCSEYPPPVLRGSGNKWVPLGWQRRCWVPSGRKRFEGSSECSPLSGRTPHATDTHSKRRRESEGLADVIRYHDRSIINSWGFDSLKESICSEFAHLVKKGGDIIGCLMRTFGPVIRALSHVFQLLKHILKQVGLTIFRC